MIFLFSCTNKSTNPDINTISAFKTYEDIIKEVGISQSQSLGEICNKYFTDDLSRENFLRIFVENVRIEQNPSIYTYIYDTLFINIAHPAQKSYIGENHFGDKDSKGQDISLIIQNTLHQSGEGFVTFYFENPETKNDEKKTSFVKYIKDTKYWLGIGFYGESLDQIDFEIDEYKRLIVRNCVKAAATGIGDVFNSLIVNNDDKVKFIRTYCDSTRFLNDLSGYFFVDDLNGRSISYPVRKDLEDSLLTDIKDINGVYPVVEMLNVINQSGSGYVVYHLENPSSKLVEKKVVYVEKIPNSEYFIGCGYYE
jgi:signal transduction histidine kinase